MLTDMVKKYYTEEYDLNCAETIMYAANEEYGLELSHQTLKTMAAFGGGMGVESTCGVITGSIAVLGVMFTKERAHESDKIKLLTQEYIDRFVGELKTEGCARLKARYRTDDERCISIVLKGADILEDIIKKNK
ncbi:MAG: C-GCAxxG-C-C family (seleno)protein [Clostridium sp.]